MQFQICFLVVFISLASFAKSGRLFLAHTNDVHAKLFGIDEYENMCSFAKREANECVGGLDKVAFLVEKFRKTQKNLIVLDAGDQFQGSIFHLVYSGLASAEIMNMIGYNAMAVGNHEFDNGPLVLAEFISKLKFPILSANIDVSASPELNGKIQPYSIVNINGQRVGVIGLTTESTSFLSSPGDKVKFLSVIESAKKTVAQLKDKVDVIIALSHCGLNKDIETAKAVDGIAVFIAGHTNSLLSNNQAGADGPCPLVVKSPSGNSVLLVSAYAYGKFLGVLEFTYNDKGVPTTWGGEPILLDHTIGRNEAVAQKIIKKYEPILEYEKEVVGQTPVQINGMDCRFKECAFGNFIADSMLSFGAKVGAQIALINGGGIRASIPKGNVNQVQLRDVMPFDKKVVFLKLTGQQIVDALEHGSMFVHDKKAENTGRFLQVSGLRYLLNEKNPVGKRVLWAKLQLADKSFVPIEKNQIYPVVTNTYLADGGDDYVVFQKSLERWTMEMTTKNLLSGFFKSPKSQLSGIEGRIEIVSK